MPTNDFLKQFIEMRRSVAPNPSAAAAAAKAEPAAKKTKKGNAIREVMEGNIAYIIEEKPNKKHVMEYFQEMCDGLTAKKMG